MRVLSVSSSRADVGILAPVWAALAERADVDLHVFLTGMHLAAGAPDVSGVPAGATVHSGGEDLGGASGGDAARAMAAITRATGDLLAETGPDLLLIMGDRLDMLPAAVAGLPFNIPIAHLHGGEVTEGAIDDRVRHAVSKLAHLHCVSSEGARTRLMAMGVPAADIVVTGAPGLDTLRAAPKLSMEAFAEEVGIAELAGPVATGDDVTGDAATGDGGVTGLDRLRLVTVHPETNAADPLAPLEAVLAALDARPGPTLFTAPNSDPGGATARRRIEAFAEARPWAHFVDTLGPRLYANALRLSAMMIGNSSSGLIEAGLFGLPVINVGDRQKGRERGGNVVTVAADASAAIDALDRLGPLPRRFQEASPYGDGASGERVAMAIVSGCERAEAHGRAHFHMNQEMTK